MDALVKPWLAWPEQLRLLQDRGLIVDDVDACEMRLSSVNYYRFAGYARYFQKAPHEGDNHFIDGTTFQDIWELYESDADLRSRLIPALAQVEVSLRTRYAYVVGRDVDPCGRYLDDSFFAGATTSESLREACLKDLNRSRERFILRYRDDARSDRYAYLPVWSAVEAFSFGTLSKCIERGHDGNLHRTIAQQLGIAKGGFQSRIKAFVYLRNRCAHHARLWRHSVVDAGATPNNIKNRAKRVVGQFDPRSVMDVLVSLDDFLDKTGRVTAPVVPELLERHGHDSLFLHGLRQPRSHIDGGRG